MESTWNPWVRVKYTHWVTHTGIGFEMSGLVVQAGIWLNTCWVGVVRVVAIVSANMGYARWDLQEREWGWRMGAG
jgi:hypothetical protein